VNTLQRLFYRLSGHDARKESWEHEQAKRAFLQTGIEIGKKHVPTPVISHGTCPKHPLVLLTYRGYGEYICMSCKDEDRNTGPIRAMHPMMSLYNEARRKGAGKHTAVQQSVRLTQDLRNQHVSDDYNPVVRYRKYKGDPE
jgi:hypothetical protein